MTRRENEDGSLEQILASDQKIVLGLLCESNHSVAYTLNEGFCLLYILYANLFYPRYEVLLDLR